MTDDHVQQKNFATFETLIIPVQKTFKLIEVIFYGFFSLSLHASVQKLQHFFQYEMQRHLTTFTLNLCDTIRTNSAVRRRLLCILCQYIVSVAVIFSASYAIGHCTCLVSTYNQMANTNIDDQKSPKIANEQLKIIFGHLYLRQPFGCARRLGTRTESICEYIKEVLTTIAPCSFCSYTVAAINVCLPIHQMLRRYMIQLDNYVGQCMVEYRVILFAIKSSRFVQNLVLKIM